MVGYKGIEKRSKLMEVSINIDIYISLVYPHIPAELALRFVKEVDKKNTEKTWGLEGRGNRTCYVGLRSREGI